MTYWPQGILSAIPRIPYFTKRGPGMQSNCMVITSAFPWAYKLAVKSAIKKTSQVNAEAQEPGQNKHGAPEEYHSLPRVSSTEGLAIHHCFRHQSHT